jgi:very-short-patch-repair endonuclease
MRGGNATRTGRARALRKVENEAEEILWADLRARRLNGYKFVRQLPIGPYFADFACRERMLVVEVDGSQHVGSARDRVRDRTMNLNGWSVLRFWHADILSQHNTILESIVAALDGRLSRMSMASDMKFLPACKGGESAWNAGSAPHPPFGHLLPVNGEKE